jgi:hypothetical protein
MIKFCECGCGQKIKEGNNYILGHTNKNKTLSEEHKRKISLSNVGKHNKGVPRTEEIKKKISKATIGKKR